MGEFCRLAPRARRAAVRVQSRCSTLLTILGESSTPGKRICRRIVPPCPPPRVCCLLLTGWCVVVARERSSLSSLQSIWPAYTSRSVRHEVRRRGQRRSDRGRRRPPLTPAADIRSRSGNVLACGRTARRRRIPCPISGRKSSASRERHSGALFGAVMELDRSRARMNATTQDHPR